MIFKTKININAKKATSNINAIGGDSHGWGSSIDGSSNSIGGIRPQLEVIG